MSCIVKPIDQHDPHWYFVVRVFSFPLFIRRYLVVVGYIYILSQISCKVLKFPTTCEYLHFPLVWSGISFCSFSITVLCAWL